jgi:hypothetical protein
MLLKTTLPPFSPWTTAPSIDTLRSLYDASTDHWDDYLARLGQCHNYQRLFNSQTVHNCLRHLGQTFHILDCGVGTGAFSLVLLDHIDSPLISPAWIFQPPCWPMLKKIWPLVVPRSIGNGAISDAYRLPMHPLTRLSLPMCWSTSLTPSQPYGKWCASSSRVPP